MSVRLYAVLRFRPGTRVSLPPGLQGERLRILKGRGYSAAVAVVSRAIEASVENFVAFDRVVCLLADQSAAILPARFGALAQSAATLKSEMAERSGALTSALDHVEGRVQMTVRIPASEDPARRVEGKGNGPSGGGAAYLRMRAGVVRPPALKKLRTGLAHLVRAERFETGRAEARIYHLIDRRDVTEYLGLVKEFAVSGPFPPYAFTTGIDHAPPGDHADKKSQSSHARSSRSRTRRRSARDPGR